MNLALAIALGALVVAVFLFAPDRGGPVSDMEPVDEPPALATARPRPRRLPPLLPPDPDAASARRTVRPSGVVEALTFTKAELPEGLELGMRGWFPNPWVISEREDVAEIVKEAFSSTLDARVVRRVACWSYKGETGVTIIALEFRKLGLTQVAARSFTYGSVDVVIEFAEGETIFVAVVSEQRNARFTEMVALVRAQID